MTPESAMVFAAGFGIRMRPLTDRIPKPMIRVAGRPLIDHALEQLRGAGVARIVVNTHHLAEQIESHLDGMSDVTVIRETGRILDTGGGLRNALPLLGDDPVFTLNADYVWSGPNPFHCLAAAWDPERMDGLMLMLPRDRATGYRGPGDFGLGPDGRLIVPGDSGPPVMVYAGAQILKTEGLADIPESVFSVKVVWANLQADSRLFGVVHAGGWAEVGRPEAIPLAEALLRRAEAETDEGPVACPE